MKIKTIVVGSLSTNCYVISNNNKCIVIDPGDEENKIISYIKENNFILIAILLTHSHFDHIKCAESISMLYNVKVYSYDTLFEGTTTIDGFSFETIYVPGHSEDSICFYFYDDNVMFTGDFIFNGAIGRTDLEGGSYTKMLNSLKKIEKYSDSIVIYPGHGDKSLLGNEKLSIN